MSKLLFSIVADPHLSESNLSEVESAMKLSIDKTADKECDILYLIGDIFTDRKSQTFHVMQTFGRILDYAKEKRVTIEAFPGNHDKIDYTSPRSYLDTFRHYPFFNLHDDVSKWGKEGDWSVFILPFFREVDALLPYLEKLNQMTIPENSILFTHIAIDGVRNNDGSEVSGVLPRDTFKSFDKVFVGHYHDKQEFHNITYIGSLLQNNFGEDQNKGVTFFYDDGTIEQEPVGETKYLTVKIDLSKVNKKDIDNLIEIHEDTTDRIRFKFEGSKAKFKNIPRSLIESKGIKVAFKEEKVESVEVTSEVADNFSAFTKTAILDEWSDYCKKDRTRKNIYPKGKKILEETL